RWYRRQAPLEAEERRVAPSRARATRRELVLAERGDVLRQRQPRDQFPQSPGRRGQKAARGVDLRQPGDRGAVGREAVRGVAIGLLGGRQASALELQVAEQRLDVRDV